MGSRRSESMRASKVQEAIAMPKKRATVVDDEQIGELFWGTKKPTPDRRPAPLGRQQARPSLRSGRSSWSESPSRRRAGSQDRKGMLRANSHRRLSAASEDLAEAEEPAKEAKKEEVKRDLWGKKVLDGPKFLPGSRIQQWRPEHMNRTAVFKEDLNKALKSEDVAELLAIYSMALDIDGAIHNTTLMLATRHEVEAIKKRLRMLLKKQIGAAMKNDDIDALKAIFEEMGKDRLFKAVSGFSEVHRGRAYLSLRSAHHKLSNHNGEDERAKVKKVKDLQGATRRARLVRALTGHVAESEALLARHGGPQVVPPKLVDARGSLDSIAASAAIGIEEDGSALGDFAEQDVEVAEEEVGEEAGEEGVEEEGEGEGEEEDEEYEEF